MNIDGQCEWRPLAFSSDRLRAFVTLGNGPLLLKGQAIVVNANANVMNVEGWKREPLPSMSSIQLQDVVVDASPNLLLLSPSADLRPKDIIKDPNWTQFCGGDQRVNLWSSPRDTIGEVLLNTAALSHAADESPSSTAHYERFSVVANLWFAPAGTDCLIHREHSFIEIHSQIVGVGHMQKFHSQNHASLYAAVALAPGATTERPFCVVNNEGAFIYPWHQYFAESDCIWLAIEYHPLKNGNEHA